MFVAVDIETTGLDPNRDQILEIGVAIADDDLQITDSTTLFCQYYGPFPVTKLEWELKYVSEVWDMHKESGLIDEYLQRAGHHPTTFEADEILTEWLDDREARNYPMTGSSVHFDRAFLKAYLPVFEREFHYRNIDISTIKNLCEKWAPDLFESRPKGRKIHRPLPDIEDSLEELKHYKEMFDFWKYRVG